MANSKPDSKTDPRFNFPKGPPETYTNGSPMNPEDAMAFGMLTTFTWLLFIAIGGTSIYLLVELISSL